MKVSYSGYSEEDVWKIIASGLFSTEDFRLHGVYASGYFLRLCKIGNIIMFKLYWHRPGDTKEIADIPIPLGFSLKIPDCNFGTETPSPELVDFLIAHAKQKIM